MTDFSRFMKQNKKKLPNGLYAPTETLTNEKGEPLEWEFKRISQKEHDRIRESCTIEVPITGKPGQMRTKLNVEKYTNDVICAATVFPNLNDKELQDSYGVMGADELLSAMVDDAGEFTKLSEWLNRFLGFDKTIADKVKDAKN